MPVTVRMMVQVALVWAAFCGGLAQAEPVRVCVAHAKIKPTKSNGKVWDGVGLKGVDAAGAGVQAALSGAASAVAGATLGTLSKVTENPDVQVTLLAGDHRAIQTPIVRDVFGASWDATEATCAMLTDREQHKVFTFRVVDRDLHRHDTIADFRIVGGLPAEALRTGVWILPERDALERLELTVGPAPQHLAPTVRGQKTIGARKSETVTLNVTQAPAAVRFSYRVAGRSAGLKGAMDDRLVSVSIFEGGRRVHYQEHPKAGKWRTRVEKPGLYIVVFSNKGFVRRSARRVDFEHQIEPL